MQTEKEIEFKTEISALEYENLIIKFNLQENIYKLTNYYFETPYQIFFKTGRTLRIRIDDNSATLTLKSRIKQGTLEKHVNLNNSDVAEMIGNGFNIKKYFNIDLDVIPYGKLTTCRTSLAYKEGVLFFDKFTYFDITKYELEYEVKDYEEGLKDFLEFLKEEKITFVLTPKKSRRVFEYLQKNNPS